MIIRGDLGIISDLLDDELNIYLPGGGISASGISASGISASILAEIPLAEKRNIHHCTF